MNLAPRLSTVSLRSKTFIPRMNRTIFSFHHSKAGAARKEARQRMRSLMSKFWADKDWFAGTQYINAARYIQAAKSLKIRKLRYTGEERYAGQERHWIIGILAIIGSYKFASTYHHSVLNTGKLKHTD